MPTGYIVVSSKGDPPPFFRVQGIPGEYRYEIDHIPYDTPPLEGTIKYRHGGRGYCYAKSRASAVEFANESSSVLLRVEGEPEDEAGSMVACRQLSILEAISCFCHPAQLEHPEAVALAAQMASLVVGYCPDPLVMGAIEAADRYAVTRLPSARVLASQAAEALTHRISEEPPLNGVTGPLAAMYAAEAARAAAATATAPLKGAADLEINAWPSIAASWLRQREEDRLAEAWAARAAKESEFAVLTAVRNAAGARPTLAAPWQREVKEKVWEQWVSWGDLLFGGMTAVEFMQGRTVDSALQEVVRGTLTTEAKPRSPREMKGELVPISKTDADRFDKMFAALWRLVLDVNQAAKTRLAGMFAGLDVGDHDQLIAQCIERYMDSLPISVIKETLRPAKLGLITRAGWMPPFVPLGPEDFKVRWDDDGQPFQVVIQTASGPATFQISQSRTDFPAGERIEVYELQVHPSTALLSWNRRYAFELLGWG